MIRIKTKKEIEILKEGGKILAEVLYEVMNHAAPGIFSSELEELANKRIKSFGAEPSFKNYQGSKDDIPFPSSLCCSINEAVVHGPCFPGQELKTGDVVGFDLGIKFKDLYTDMARTIGIGKIEKRARKLIDTTKICLELAQKQVKAGNSISDISAAVQNFAEKKGFGIVKNLVGHGVGYAVHEEPRIPNYVDLTQPKIELKEGIVLAIEPMLTMGKADLTVGKDGWTQITRDKSLTAHFENTVVVTATGFEVITKI
ncbi:type I methionyl aminopeptidase [Candidatus Parcubacteria bacterium]|nr:MAG: type I methionyl aminopeptidase [Candidatus Parcubacteria bacterium]